MKKNNNNISLVDISNRLDVLLFINSVIATELIQITENTSQLVRGEDVPLKCQNDHDKIRKKIIEIGNKYFKEGTEILKKHVLEH